jgi:hypothetical protein
MAGISIRSIGGKMSELILKYNAPIETKLSNFEKYVKRQALSRFLVRYELFRKVREVKGSIIECGVHHGGGLFAWAKLSSALEPYALHRKIIGFDTFEGFPDTHAKDMSTFSGSENKELKAGGFKSHDDIYEELQECVAEYDNNRFLNQFSKIEMVKGDALQTIPSYLENNQHLLIALLFLDFDLYEPTEVALKYFLPRIPKGGIIAFDEINNQFWPGETVAMLENMKPLGNYSIRKFDFDPNIAYIQL